MPNWIVKSVVQNILGLFPKSYKFNAVLQKHWAKSYFPSDKVFYGKLDLARKHYDYFTRFSESPEKKITALELGTGSWPIIPIALYLKGTSKIYTYDIVPLLESDIMKKILKQFYDAHLDGKLAQYLGGINAERMRVISSLYENEEDLTPVNMLESMNILWKVGDASRTYIVDHTIDFIFSTVVLEHIDAEIILKLLTEFRRIAASTAVMSHYIGLADQYASFDSSITTFNFLKYSDRQWRILNNPITPLSRLRLPEYRLLFKQANWDIVEEKNQSGAIADLRKVNLAKRFEKYSESDLLVNFSWLVTRPSGRAPH